MNTGDVGFNEALKLAENVPLVPSANKLAPKELYVPTTELVVENPTAGDEFCVGYNTAKIVEPLVIAANFLVELYW